jgi:hypothetical protein
MRAHSLRVLAAIAGLSIGAICSNAQQSSAPRSATGPASVAEVAAGMDDCVASYRKIIVLMDGAAALDEGNRERVRTAAWILFEKNHDRLDEMEQALRTDAGRQESPLVAAFLNRLESSPDLRDADKLAFRDVLDGLAQLPAQEAPSVALRKRIGDDAAALEQIQNLYQKEISQIFSGFQARGMAVHREAWGDYVAFLKTKYNREQVLRESASQLPRGGDTRRRGSQEQDGNLRPGASPEDRRAHLRRRAAPPLHRPGASHSEEVRASCGFL